MWFSKGHQQLKFILLTQIDYYIIKHNLHKHQVFQCSIKWKSLSRCIPDFKILWSCRTQWTLLSTFEAALREHRAAWSLENSWLVFTDFLKRITCPHSCTSCSVSQVRLNNSISKMNGAVTNIKKQTNSIIWKSLQTEAWIITINLS